MRETGLQYTQPLFLVSHLMLVQTAHRHVCTDHEGILLRYMAPHYTCCVSCKARYPNSYRELTSKEACCVYG